MDEVLKKLAELEQKVDAVYKSAEKTRKYFMWTLVISVVLFVLPLVALIFVIPQFLDALGGNLDLLR
jgi:type II secretory pathway component PulF